jgi:DNA-binding NarL/FixJ family response regulator
MERTRIFIADDHELLRHGLCQMLQTEPSFEIVGEAADGETALKLIVELSPDIAVLDINMPGLGGFAVINEIKRRKLLCAIVVLTMHNEEAMFEKAMSLGVKGYVLKDGAAADIVNCLHAVRRGQNYTSAGVTTYLFKRAGTTAVRPVTGIDSLTRTERTVLKLIAGYKTSREIAAELGISPRTVDNHRNNICAKLDIRRSHALVKFAIEHREEI